MTFKIILYMTSRFTLLCKCFVEYIFLDERVYFIAQRYVGLTNIACK